jgi:NADPH:quinone reductase-like Zn-dependent oxidoreductase
LGADQVIDYTQEDFTQSGKPYDVIFDVVGKSPFADSVKVLKENGRYLIANPTLTKMFRGAWVSRTSSTQVISEAAGHSQADLLFLKDLIEAGTIKPVIDRQYPLAQVPEAHRYVETGRKKGSVVILVTSDNKTE